MITVILKGGLGNQMFQYATARAVAEENKDQLYLNTFWFDTQSKRELNIKDFNIQGEIIETGLIKRLAYKIPLFKKRGIIGDTYIKEQERFVFDESIFKTSGSIIMEGYWQNEKYFKDIRDTLKKEFSLKKPLGGQAHDIKNKIDNCNSVSLHFRRGDYIKNEKLNKIYGASPMKYYRQALDIVSDKVEDSTLFIFSDDIGWVKENFKINKQVTYVSQKDIKDTEELILMSRCKHNIIANSTFSWWAAWLNDYEEKLVIAPQKWFNNSNRKTSDLIPNSWKRI